MGTYQWKTFTLLVSAEEVKGNEMKIGDRVKYVGSDGYYRKDRLGKFGVITGRYDESSVNVKTESGDVWYGVYDRNLEVIKNGSYQSPIRTVTRREIVAGNYGVIQVHKDGKIGMLPSVKSADQLREAAHILNQIAEVLEDNGDA